MTKRMWSLSGPSVKAVAGSLAAVSVLVGCAAVSEEKKSEGTFPPALAAIQKFDSEVLSKGPYGETSADVTTIQLTDEEIEKVKALNATAAVVMHFSGDSWSVAQIAGMKQEFDRLGIEIVATTDAQGNPAKQVSDIETVLARNPDVMVSIPSLDVVATAPAYEKAVAAGVKLVFMENAAQGMKPGKDYVSVVATDNYGQGVITAHLMANSVGGKGEIGTVFHAAKAPTNVDRYQGFLDTMKKSYPEIEIVESKGLLGPDWKGQGEQAANAMLVKHQNLAGIWCWFDVPCEGALAAARALGRNQVAVTTVDLGKSVAIDVAAGGMVSGIGAAQPFDQGVTEARLAAYALIGKEAPPFVALPALPVYRDNLLESWKTVYHDDAPEEALKAFDMAKD